MAPVKESINDMVHLGGDLEQLLDGKRHGISVRDCGRKERPSPGTCD